MCTGLSNPEDKTSSMHYSLINRFRGALLGTAIGEILGANCQQPQAWREIEHWGFRNPVEPSAWGKMAVMQAHFLINEKCRIPIPNANDEKVMIALIPIALFYHEDLTLLKIHLEAALGCASTDNAADNASADNTADNAADNAADNTADNTADSASAQVLERCLQIGEAIALTLQEKSAPHPDFRLTLLQTAKLPHPQVHCAIAGALAGAAHSIAGIPPSWRQRLNNAGYASFWGLTSEAELLKIADDLLAAWSGVYHPTQRLINPVVAAPRMIRRELQRFW
jgi:hypothetical protein